eukprot:TRINITY_DN3640_c0_g2_i1.p1 TRINITY_DN3640_c0_g2~~TRINITY_DN3640_c0_g2_i1.p1  ORF type:complete len:866 (+),score=140.71 TRINITY_DN3640_c0_g2_i1:238-2598(+)
MSSDRSDTSRDTPEKRSRKDRGKRKKRSHKQDHSASKEETKTASPRTTAPLEKEIQKEPTEQAEHRRLRQSKESSTNNDDDKEKNPRRNEKKLPMSFSTISPEANLQRSMRIKLRNASFRKKRKSLPGPLRSPVIRDSGSSTHRSRRKRCLGGHSRLRNRAPMHWSQIDAVVLHIFRFCDWKDLIRVGIVCKTWSRLAQNPETWHALYIKRWKSAEETSQSNWEEAFLARIRSTLEKGYSLINSKTPWDGIDYMIKEKHVENDPPKIAQMLFNGNFSQDSISLLLEKRQYRTVRKQIQKLEDRREKKLDDSWLGQRPLEDYATLPEDVILQIFTYLNGVGDLLIVAQVCKVWASVSSASSLWKPAYISWFWNWNWNSRKILAERMRLKTFSHILSPRSKRKCGTKKRGKRNASRTRLSEQKLKNPWKRLLFTKFKGADAEADVNADANNVLNGKKKDRLIWTKLKPENCEVPQKLFRHTASAIGTNIYVFGGDPNNGLSILDTITNQWRRPKTTGPAPKAYQAHSSCAIGDKLYIYGGGHKEVFYESLHILDTATLTWTAPQMFGDIPKKRRAHVAAVVKSEMVIFGGSSGRSPATDIHVLNTDTMHWAKLDLPQPAIEARGYLSATTIGDCIVFFGGTTNVDVFTDVRILHIGNRRWLSEKELNFSSLARFGHSANKIGNWLLVFGGNSGKHYLNDVTLLNLETMSWFKLDCSGARPSPRSFHTSVVVDKKMYVVGGYCGTDIGDTHVLDMSRFCDVLRFHHHNPNKKKKKKKQKKPKRKKHTKS